MTTPRWASALYWYPRIKSMPGVLPARFVHFNDILPTCLGPSDVPKPLERACRSIGYPVFIRSDLASTKYAGAATYSTDGPEGLMRVITAIVKSHADAGLEPSALMVRPWLHLKGAFQAFGGHLIAREWRVFAAADRVLCTHFYWSADDIEFYGGITPPKDWKDLFERLKVEPPPASELNSLAVLAARACTAREDAPNAWAVDFAEDVSGVWHLIDMEPAQGAWHAAGCTVPTMATR